MKINIVLTNKEVLESRNVCKTFNIPQQEESEYDSGKWGHSSYDESHMELEINPNLVIGIMKIAVRNSTAIIGLTNMIKGVAQIYAALTDQIGKEVKDLYKNL